MDDNQVNCEPNASALEDQEAMVSVGDIVARALAKAWSEMESNGGPEGEQKERKGSKSKHSHRHHKKKRQAKDKDGKKRRKSSSRATRSGSKSSSKDDVSSEEGLLGDELQSELQGENKKEDLGLEEGQVDEVIVQKRENYEKEKLKGKRRGNKVKEKTKSIDKYSKSRHSKKRSVSEERHSSRSDWYLCSESSSKESESRKRHNSRNPEDCSLLKSDYKWWGSSDGRRKDSSRRRSESPSFETGLNSRRRSRSRSPSPLRSKNREDIHAERTRSRSPFYKGRRYFDSVRRRSLSPVSAADMRRNMDRSRSVSRCRKVYSQEEEIDKERLLAIARDNLVKMVEKGDLPEGTDVNKLKLKHLRELSTQKSVQQWTEFCRAISAMEAAAYSDSSLSDSDIDSDDDTKSVASSVTFMGRHPFQLNERKEIAIRVRDFPSIQPRTAKEVQVELREQFPVSSGCTHRTKESEWKEVAVMPPPTAPAPKKKKQDQKKAEPEQLSEPEQPFVASNESVFPVFNAMPLDIGSVMSQRLGAMRKLQEDPFNVVALKQMHQAQEMMQNWAQSKVEPGQFTGETGVNVLQPKELEGLYPAWARKDQLKTALPIGEGIGMHLLKKMGWKPGEGLGKDGQGVTEPIMPALKLDTKGLVAEEEKVKNLPQQLVGLPEGVDGKHPVSMIQEYCTHKKWMIPEYEMVEEDGPPHKKNFTMKVTVNGVSYQPTLSCASKKQAKALAASVCLQAFGLLPKDNV